MSYPAELQMLSSGIEGLDQILEGPRWADTVVFCLSDWREYNAFLEPMADFLQARNIPIHYVRFTDKPASISPSFSKNLRVYDLFPIESTESLCDELNEVFGTNSASTFYAFDDLSSLASVAKSDDELVKLVRRIHLEVARRQAAAYIAVDKSQVSAQTLAGLKDSASICVDVRSVDGTVHLQPI